MERALQAPLQPLQGTGGDLAGQDSGECLLCGSSAHAVSRCSLKQNWMQLVASLQTVNNQLMEWHGWPVVDGTEQASLAGGGPFAADRSWLELAQRKALMECLLHRMQVKLSFHGPTITGFDGATMQPLPVPIATKNTAPPALPQRSHRSSAIPTSYSAHHRSRHASTETTHDRASLPTSSHGLQDALFDTPIADNRFAAAHAGHRHQPSPHPVQQPNSAEHADGHQHHYSLRGSGNKHLHRPRSMSMADQLDLLLQQEAAPQQAGTANADIFGETHNDVSRPMGPLSNVSHMHFPSVQESSSADILDVNTAPGDTSITNWLDQSFMLEQLFPEQDQNQQQQDLMFPSSLLQLPQLAELGQPQNARKSTGKNESLSIAQRTRKQDGSLPKAIYDDLHVEKLFRGIDSEKDQPQSSDMQYERFLKSLANDDTRTDDFLLDDENDDEICSEDIGDDREPEEEYRDDPDVTIGPDELAELLHDGATYQPLPTLEYVEENIAVDPTLFHGEEYEMLTEQLQANLQLTLQNYAAALDLQEIQPIRFWQRQLNGTMKICKKLPPTLSITGFQQIEQVAGELGAVADKNRKSQGVRRPCGVLPTVRYVDDKLKKEFNADLRIVPITDNGILNRRFSKAEDKLLLMGLFQFGTSNWKIIEEYYVPARTAKQLSGHFCKLRSAKGNNKHSEFKDYYEASRIPLKAQELDLLRKGVALYGSNFNRISSRLLPHKPPSVLRVKWEQAAPMFNSTASFDGRLKRKNFEPKENQRPMMMTTLLPSNQVPVESKEQPRASSRTSSNSRMSTSSHSNNTNKRSRTHTSPAIVRRRPASAMLTSTLPPPPRRANDQEQEMQQQLRTMEDMFFDFVG